MRKMTSAEIAKTIKGLDHECAQLLQREREACVYTIANGEDPNEARPDYDYSQVQNKIASLQEETRRLRHSLNVFNTTQVVPGFDMTIDQMLVYIPQLNQKVQKLDTMRSRFQKTRKDAGSFTSFWEYECCNYDVKKAEADYKVAAEELRRAQNILDKLNSTVEIELD
ncbi:MAG: hypothetical protein ACI4SL_09015 [Candidatus Ornithospirochaeta sp.]